MKLLLSCKRKKCVPPLISEVDGEIVVSMKPRDKVVVCALCKSLKVREV